jgi:hypothetical protein
MLRSDGVTGSSANEDEVRHQALIGRRNRRVAEVLEEVWAGGVPEARAPGGLLGEYLCTCGRPECGEVVVLSLDEFRFVREQPYRFIVAPGHATEVDEVVRRGDGYDVVEIVELHRHLVQQSSGAPG